MTQNMFQEGLYHVFFKEKPSTRLQAQATIHGELDNVRIHRWFGTVVNTRLLVTGYLAAGSLAMEVQRKANKPKIILLIVLNIFSFLFGFSALLANSLILKHPAALSTNQQRAGSYVARGSSVAFSVLCFLSSIYILFLSWRGLRRYSAPHAQAYNRLSQDLDETNGPLLEQEVFSL
ncbi:transmembrane protein 253 isoform X2 [Paralichthys olivaceus]|uniref:transmembrane protein 253 isoform X2 n=1 Tax=Paralichthys olivaceus TaxID=8255 RepID=UPI00097DAFD3|nr:PREDICTED: uncharacterized protein LOC109624244 isoform X3 [Paralichthys olivaceus]